MYHCWYQIATLHALSFLHVFAVNLKLSIPKHPRDPFLENVVGRSELPFPGKKFGTNSSQSFWHVSKT